MIGFTPHEAPYTGDNGENEPQRGKCQVLVLLVVFSFRYHTRVDFLPQTSHVWEGGYRIKDGVCGHGTHEEQST